MSDGKRKAPPASDEELKKQMRAEGWTFSNDVPKPKEEDWEPDDLVAAVCQSGALAVPPILRALNKDDTAIARKAQACTAVSELASRDHGRGIALKAGAVAAVVHALRGPASAQVAENGCLALSSLAVGDGASAVLEGGGVEAVLAVMAAHATTASVQAKGCLAVGNMSFSEEGEAMVIAAGGVYALAAALRIAEAHEAVAEEACDCLTNLVGGDAGRSAVGAFDWFEWAAACDEQAPCAPGTTSPPRLHSAPGRHNLACT